MSILIEKIVGVLSEDGINLLGIILGGLSVSVMPIDVYSEAP